MTQAKSLVLPGYLLLCIIVGGSSQAIWGNAVLQLLGLAIIVWALVDREAKLRAPGGRGLLALIAAGAVLLALQLVPLPPAVWTGLSGRGFVADGLRMLGSPLPWLPVSLSPYDTSAAALTLLPPVALLVGMLRLQCWRRNWMFGAVLAGAAVSVLLGVLQVGSDGDSSWYFYRHTNLGVAVGTFANGNHFATILLASLPLLGALIAAQWRGARTREARLPVIALAVTGLAVFAIGVLINRSTAMLLLGPPVAAATLLMMLRLPPRRVRQGLAGVALLLAASAVAVPIAGRDLPKLGTEASIQTRVEYWGTTMRAARDHFPLGTGFGTFQGAYRQYEDPTRVDLWYINHAHNDYAELALEGGLPAMLLILLFLVWWARRSAAAWASPTEMGQQAASIASAAILLHSAFDYPLRTAAISAIFALCLALLAGSRGKRAAEHGETVRPRHATL